MVFETEGLSSQSNLVRGTNPTDQEPEPVNKVLESEPDRKCCLILLLSTAEHERCEERHNKKISFSDISILIWLKQMKRVTIFIHNRTEKPLYEK